MSMLQKQKPIENANKVKRNSSSCNSDISLNLLRNSEKLLNIQKELCFKLDTIQFKSPIDYIYNPLKYAKNLHEAFVKKYFENSTKKILFLGMNPGPWGMCQTGVVFGEKKCVKEWLQLSGSVEKPVNEHPKKKILGLNCHRNEVSGKKFWAFFQTLCETPEKFFRHSFVYNHCCLAFMSTSGKNITPPEIKDINVRKQLYSFCDEAFIQIIKEFDFKIVVGIGKFAEKSAKVALKSSGLNNIKVYSIPHPSPRNAKNFGNWEQITLQKLMKCNLLKYFTDNSQLTS